MIPELAYAIVQYLAGVVGFTMLFMLPILIIRKWLTQ